LILGLISGKKDWGNYLPAGGLIMVFSAYQGDITDVGTDVIVNAANGVGIMGRGVAGALSRAGGPEIQAEAKEIAEKEGPFEPGCCYCTTPGKLSEQGVKIIIHAVTMKFPGGPTSYDFVIKAAKASIKQAVNLEYESIAIPALGGGIGRLDKDQLAVKLVGIARVADHLIDIVFVDRDRFFIDEVRRLGNLE
jgi:O-acetyl-ADP-ribose deacetylase